MRRVLTHSDNLTRGCASATWRVDMTVLGSRHCDPELQSGAHMQHAITLQHQLLFALPAPPLEQTSHVPTWSHTNL